MTHWPLRLKIALWNALFVTVVFGAVGALVSMHLFREGLKEADESLAHAAAHFFREVSARSSPVNWGSLVEVDSLFSRDGVPYYAEVSSGDQKILYRSRAIERAEIPPLVPDGSAIIWKHHGDILRLAAYQRNGITLRLGVDARLAYSARTDVLVAFLVVAPFVFGLVAFAGWRLAVFALAPVHEATAAAEAITAERLDQRLPVPKSRDEIAQLAEVLNRMIDRLESSFKQARRFTADASHELRTPLTIIRGELENSLRLPDLPATIERLLLDLLEETNHLASITDGLLLLSRADAGRLTLSLIQVDLSNVVTELLEDAEILASAENIRVESTIESGIEVDGHEPFLRQLVLNLVENAIKYNRLGGTVRIELKRDGSQIVFTVGNTGDGIRPEQAHLIFDRFYRGEPSRDSEKRGHGLGLSICHELARAHGGEIVLVESRPDWTEFRVKLPLPMEPTAGPSH